MTRTTLFALALLVALGAHAQTAKKPARAVTPKAAPAPAAPAPPAQPPLAAADDAQREAAAMTHVGDHQCELGQKLHLHATPGHEGYIDVEFGKRRFTMKPVLSRTGALRLEDVTGRMLLLQIAVKSMLMDVQAGNRVADDCVHAKHIEMRKVVAAAPPQPGLGIDPVRAVADAVAADAAVAVAAAASAAAAAAVTLALEGARIIEATPREPGPGTDPMRAVVDAVAADAAAAAAASAAAAATVAPATTAAGAATAPTR